MWELTDISLCETHLSTHQANLPSLLLIRDVLHALLVPIVELFDKACSVAAQYTHATRLEDLEFAFTAHARTALVWLQCSLSSIQERDWCYTRGCPACVVNHSLDSEFSIRLLHTACLLSDVHYPFTFEGPTLPSFMFFLESLERALEEDELWGLAFYEQVKPKAAATRDGIEELIHQSLELDGIIMNQASSSSPSSPDISQPATPVLAPIVAQPGMRVQRSKMARRQAQVQFEEERMMDEMQRTCWSKLPVADEDVKAKQAVVVQVLGSPASTPLPPSSGCATCGDEIAVEPGGVVVDEPQNLSGVRSDTKS
nr:hypothetical protein CFP56_28831 [Quercus suber]